MANFFIAIGGTGARCLESFLYLAGAGLVREPLHILIIDPDLNNGNSFRTRQLVNDYHEVHLAGQPENIRYKWWGTPPQPTLFQAAINQVADATGQHPIFWNLQQNNQRKFRDVIQYDDRPQTLKNFLSLFYEQNDLEMPLNVGYQGRTNVGAVALKQDLEETRRIDGSGLKELLAAMAQGLQNEEARVFVVGSVFGGTGAAGIPTLPALIQEIDNNDLPDNLRGNIRWGCAMMTPYFSFPTNPNRTLNLGPGTDSTRHPIATQAALLHYAHVPPEYQNVYFIGAPTRQATNDKNEPGGQYQRNNPHYAELAAALAAWDFFTLEEVQRNSHQLHFVDTYREQQNLGVSWDTLPVNPLRHLDRHEDVKRKLVAFTTFAYLYKNILHERFVNSLDYENSKMYQVNFGNLKLTTQAESEKLGHLYSFCEMYLEWLRQIGLTGGQRPPVLFNWAAFDADNATAYSSWLGNLMQTGNLADQRDSMPKYANDGYDQILKKLDGIRLQSPGTKSASGLFIYLLHHAVMDFCKENYRWH